ncbi:MAG: hypothetical protein E4G93_05495, partial [Dehalococcoidia bacterium]
MHPERGDCLIASFGLCRPKPPVVALWSRGVQRREHKEDTPDMNVEDIRKAGIIGAGIMGHGIAQALATAGYSVCLTDVNKGALDSALGRVERNLGSFVDAGLVSANDVPTILGRIRVAPTLEQTVEDTDIVFEAAAEDQELKRVLFNKLDAVCPERTILASNSSSLLISEFASETHRQDRCILTHWMNPPHIVPAVEVIPG